MQYRELSGDESFVLGAALQLLANTLQSTIESDWELSEEKNTAEHTLAIVHHLIDCYAKDRVVLKEGSK